MNINNFCCAAACIAMLFCMTGFSATSVIEKDGFMPTNCTSHEQCEDVCFKGENLYSRCDPNGTCICDCSEPSEFNGSYTSACEGRQPDGHWRDYCDSYCTSNYLRPCRYCNDSTGNFYCTCVCSAKPITRITLKRRYYGIYHN